MHIVNLIILIGNDNEPYWWRINEFEISVIDTNGYLRKFEE